MFFNNELVLNSDMGQASLEAQLNGLHSYLEANALSPSKIVTQQSWIEMQGQLIEMRQRIPGADIIADLDSRVRPVDLGKFVSTYQMIGGMQNTTSVTIDGGKEATYDHVAYLEDGDPVPVFKEGYGANWRKVASMNTVDINLLLDSQRQASHNFNETVVNYYLNGSENINFGGYQGEGLLTHRNTLKIDLGTGGDFKINLVTASPTQLMTFFKNLRTIMNENFITNFDVLWVSPEVKGNLDTKLALIADGKYGGDLGATVEDYLGSMIPAESIRASFGLKGNEFLAYERDVIRKRVAMPTTITPLPRTTPNANHNFEIISVEGLNIETDAKGVKGVFFGSDITTAVA